MDHKIVDMLERDVKAALPPIFLKRGLGKLPLLPSDETIHLMAKAAVAVYEAAVANQREEA